MTPRHPCPLSWLTYAGLSIFLVLLAEPGLGQTPARIIINFDAEAAIGPFRNIASGFLGHIDDGVTNPPRAVLEDSLFPRWWRDSFIKPRAYQMVQGYQRNLDHGWPDSTPWLSPSSYRAFCKSVAGGALDAGYHLQWDIWNEPNHQQICDQNLAETYRICYEGLYQAYFDRNRVADLVVGGPSHSSLFGDCQLLQFLFKNGSAGAQLVSQQIPSAPADFGSFSFLEFLQQTEITLENGETRPLKLDFLSFHMFHDSAVMQWGEHIKALAEAVEADFGSRMPMYVNEYTSGSSHSITDWFLRPGHAAVVFAELHEVRTRPGVPGVEGAMRACWNDPVDGSSGCANKTVNGLLHPQNLTVTRPVWWTYKLYADMARANLLEAPKLTVEINGQARSLPRISGVAAGDHGRREFRALLGFTGATYYGSHIDSQLTQVALTVEARGLPPNCSLNVALQSMNAPSFSQGFTQQNFTASTIPGASYSGTSYVFSAGEFSTENLLYVTLDQFVCSSPSDTVIPGPPTDLLIE